LQEAEVPGLVRGYAALLKAAGLPPERVLVLVKEFARTSIAPHLPTRSDDASEALLTREELTGRVVTWCIDAYYAAADSSAGAHDETTKQRGAGTGLLPSRPSIRPPQEHHS
jgi:hypothetical protein